MLYSLGMKSKKRRPSPLQDRLRQQLLSLWPALKGSLAQVRKPCIRPNCPACARGDKHSNYLLAFTQAGRRRCLYVPLEMVPLLKRALNNGRRIERLLNAMGPALLRQFRSQNPAKTGPAAHRKHRKTLTNS